MSWRHLGLALLCWAFIGTAQAHKPSDSYLSLRVGDQKAGDQKAGDQQASGQQLSGQWDIALRDLDFAIGLDADGDGRITWGETRAKHAEIAAYALARLSLEADGRPCRIEVPQQQIDHHTDGAYTVLHLAIDCAGPTPSQLTLDYRLFADLDPQHRGLLNLSARGQTRTAVFGPENRRQQFALAELSRWSQFVDYAREGVWHIWIGFDHILFLLSLLLPAVLVWRERAWIAAERFSGSFVEVAKVVTAFTVAHSITLSLATLGVISLPSRWVESAIAASVVLAALNNVWPVFHGRRWLVAFCFGLIHGFGFASVLADLGLPPDALLLALVGFNLGVEGGQLAIVAVFLPIAFALRRTWLYRRVVFIGGSLLIALLAGVWLAERVGNFKLLPF
ncbi:MAG: HupE/UreJ family protein [Rhizobacter sp.]|nr:HupE/UreJ family protein [Rhizobacter sp.]